LTTKDGIPLKSLETNLNRKGGKKSPTSRHGEGRFVERRPDVVRTVLVIRRPGNSTWLNRYQEEKNAHQKKEKKIGTKKKRRKPN